jgi:CubicO group peptidase (beta-lactamase class C family)
MSTGHELLTEVELASQYTRLKPSNLLLPGAQFTYFALTAVIAGAVLALVT